MGVIFSGVFQLNSLLYVPRTPWFYRCVYNKVRYIGSRCAAMLLWRILDLVWEEIFGSLCIGHLSIILLYLRSFSGSEEQIYQRQPSSPGCIYHTHAHHTTLRRLTAYALMCSWHRWVNKLVETKGENLWHVFPEHSHKSASKRENI